MKLPNIKIIDEKNKILHQKSKEVTFPLTEKQKKDINDMITHLTMSQIEVEREKYDLRAGMGLSYVQIGVLERLFVVVDEIDHEKFQNYVIINPKIISMSEELIYVGEGEGCLSVNREVEGIVPRHARMTIEYQDEDGNTKTLRVREELSICFQHEMDHLDGILFTDKIDKKNPYKDQEIMREI